MRIIPFLRGQAFDPEALTVMDAAFQAVCRSLELTNGDDLHRETVALKVIEIAQTGQRDPDQLAARVLEELQ
jgi:hypothetical protein